MCVCGGGGMTMGTFSFLGGIVRVCTTKGSGIQHTVSSVCSFRRYDGVGDVHQHQTPKKVKDRNFMLK